MCQNYEIKKVKLELIKPKFWDKRPKFKIKSRNFWGFILFNLKISTVYGLKKRKKKIKKKKKFRVRKVFH